MNDETKVTGWVEVLHYDQNMNLIKKFEFKNLVVSSGLQWVASRCSNSPPAVMGYIAVGTSNQAPATGDTALIAEIGRVSMDVPGGSPTGASILYTALIGPGVATGALQEAGLLNNATGGTMLSRVTYPVINKGATDTIAVNWTISFN